MKSPLAVLTAEVKTRAITCRRVRRVICIHEQVVSSQLHSRHDLCFRVAWASVVAKASPSIDRTFLLYSYIAALAFAPHF